MADNRMITMDEMLATVDASLDNQDTQKHQLFKNWIWRAYTILGVTKADIKTECLQVTNFRFDKPCDFVMAIGIDLYDEKDFLVNYKWKNDKWLTADQQQKSTQQVNNIWPVLMTEGKDCYYISSNATMVTKAEIKYYSHPIDENGDYMVPMIYMEAFIAFIKKEMAAAGFFKGDKVSASQMSLLLENWLYEQRQAMSKRRVLDMKDAEAISRAWLSKIPNFRNLHYRN